MIYYKSSTEHQTVYCNDTTFITDTLNRVVCDRLGYSLIGFSSWTMTLLTEFDNENVEQFINF